MQIIFLPEWITISICFLVWPTIQISVAIISRTLPDRFFKNDNFIFKSYLFEQNGKLYERYFKIKRWKKFLPDGSAITGVGVKKKHLYDKSQKGLELFIIESCRAEFLHLASIPPFIIFGLFCPPYVVLLMLLYALAVNLPCILAQRYNRPRIIKFLERRSNLQQSATYYSITRLKVEAKVKY